MCPTQMVPATSSWPTTGYTAELHSRNGGTSGKVCLMQGETLHGSEKWGKEGWETTLGAPRWDQEGKKVLQVLEEGFHCSSWSTPYRAGGFVLEELQPMESTHAGWRGSVRRKEQQRGAVKGWPLPPFPMPLLHTDWGEIEESGMEEGTWTWEKKGVGGMSCFNFCLWFSLSKSIGNQLNKFSPCWLCFARYGKQSPCPYLDLSSISPKPPPPPPIQLRMESKRVVG